MKQVNRIKRELLSKPDLTIAREDYLSSGYGLVNLACTGKTYGAFIKGDYILIVGASASGKTFLALTTLAEASINPNFDDYNLIYDGPEYGARMKWTDFFGKHMVDRTEFRRSSTLDEFYYNLDSDTKKDRPFVCVLDSMDSLSSKEEQKKFGKQKTAFLKGEKAAGSYSDGKAKTNSSNIRVITNRMRDKGSILIIIAQERDNMGIEAMFGKTKTRAGGRALTYYAQLELWMNPIKQLKRKVRDKTRHIGDLCSVKVTKNRFTGRKTSVKMPIYFSFGIDDIGGCIDYLLEEKHWTKRKGTIDAKELVFSGTKDELAIHIQEHCLERRLYKIVGGVWREIQAACAINRKSKY